MKVVVNQEACIGCGACTSVAEELFEMNDEGHSTLKVNEITKEQEEKANEAIDVCPTGAISEETEEKMAA